MVVKFAIPVSALVASLTTIGCSGAESSAFRAMSAVDHERAAQSDPDATGVAAAEHRQAARQLRESEAYACAEIPDSERDLGPFARRDRIVGFEEVRDRLYPKASPQLFGVNFTLRATPGVTEQWLSRVIGCHLAHYAVVGASSFPAPSPLLVPGARIQVSSTADGFRVTITSRDIDVAREVRDSGRSLFAHAT